MLGAIIGDIVGSVYEWHNIKTKDFEIINPKAFFTDDTILTCAIAKAVMDSDFKNIENIHDNVTKQLIYFTKKYPNKGYGNRFERWVKSEPHIPYNSFGNGSAMRVSSVGWLAHTLAQTWNIAKATAEVTHNHPQGILGAQVVAGIIFLCRNKTSKQRIKEFAQEYYNLDFTLESIRPTYKFDETCQGTVPQAIVAFLESTDFEDAIRNAISIGGDSDTLACITGSIAQAFYGTMPQELCKMALQKIPEELKVTIVLPTWICR